MSTEALVWLFMFCVFMALLIVPAAFYEYWMRSDYRAYLKLVRARNAWRERVVPGLRQ